MKLLPVMVTLVPPEAGPVFGLMPVTVGAAIYVKWSALEAAEVPPTVVTITSTTPAPAGSMAVICVDELTVKEVADALPNCTAVAPVKLVPVMVTLVPPDAGPVFGLTPVTVGATTYVN